jgi:hypothetical protein
MNGKSDVPVPAHRSIDSVTVGAPAVFNIWGDR